MDFQVDDVEVEEVLPTRTLPDNVVKISVVGVGGGGSNMIDYMISKGTSKIDLIAANTDLQALNKSKAPKKIQLGANLTKGLGAGMKPEVGKEAALESYEEIKDVLNGADIVFVSCGLGGGTGTGAASVVASAAKEVGALSVAVVTKPFKWEGKKRAALANMGLSEIKKVVDSIIIIHNDKLVESIDDSLGFSDAFGIVNEVLYQAVNGISEVILNEGDVNTDFADIQTIMQHRGVALMGLGKAKGEDAVMKALMEAVDSPLLDKMSLTGAKGVLVHIEMNPNIPMRTVHDMMNKLHETLSDNAEVIFGTTPNSEFDIDEVKITIVATGFDVDSTSVENSISNSEMIQNYSKDDNLDLNSIDEIEFNDIELEQTKIDENDLNTPPTMRGYTTKFDLD